MKSLWILSLFFLTLISAHAEVSEREAFVALKTDLAKLKKTLSRDIKVYHWFNSSNRTINRLRPSDPYFSGALDYYSKRFFQIGDKHEVGEGFYAALDPQVSTEFGDTLIEVEIQRGTSFLDIRAGHRFGLEVTLKTKEILSDYCWNDFSQDESIYEYKGEDYQSIFKLSLASNERCLGLLNKVVQSLGVEFITYGWWPTGENFGVCKGEEKGAFLLFGKLLSSPYDFENPKIDLSSFRVHGFVPYPNFNNLSQTEREKYKFVDQFSRLSWVDYSSNKGQWSVFSDLEPRETQPLLNELSRVRFGCDKEKFPEDKLLNFKKIR